MFLDKLTSKALVGTIHKGLIVKPAVSVVLYRVLGIARKTERQETAMGTVNVLAGDFSAINVIGVKDAKGNVTHPDYQSDRAILPEVVYAPVAAVVAKSKGLPVQFAIEVGIKKSDSGDGFEYMARLLSAPAVLESMQKLVQEFLTVK